MYRKSFFAFFLLCFLLCSFSFGESVLQSDILYNQFTEDGFSPRKQALDNSNTFNFPYNIILDQNDDTNLEVKVFVSVEEALSLVPVLEDISEFATVVCTANDTSVLKPEYSAGTSTAITSFANEAIKTPVIVLSIDKKNDKFWSLSTGTNGYITPSYCYLKIKQALDSQDIYSYIKEGSLALYKLNLVSFNSVLNTLLENEYPAIKLNFPIKDSNKLVNVLKDFSKDYDFENPKNKEVNYDTAVIFSKSFIIPEFTLNLIFIVILFLSLFSICVLSFMFGKKTKAHKKTMLKYWFIAPVFLLIALFSLLIAQLLTKWIFPVWEIFPQYALLIKLLISCFIFSFFYILRRILKIPSRAFIYAYLLNIISFVNLFVFSALDLPLIILFGIEYILIYISQGFRKTSLLVIASVFLVVPFIPSLYGIFANSDINSLTSLVNGNLFVNIILSLLLLPLAFMIMRIILSVKRKHHIRKQIIKLLISISLLICFSISAFIFGRHLKKNISEKIDTIQFIETSEDLATFTLTSKTDIGFSNNHLEITTLSDVIYYDINIFNNYAFPIYSANYPFSFFDTVNAAKIYLQENPPESFFLDFITEASSDFYLEIVVYSYKNNEDKNTILVKKYNIPSKNYLKNNKDSSL